ncbi:MAG TPA: lysylphosphatidylglycerol synthase transmembrane domain-containing protein [Anaerolineales bacterium]|nr:lysylphosphatidylglycerol synthase transmembrane domain-containing protein [Anaerolineales bacterium]
METRPPNNQISKKRIFSWQNILFAGIALAFVSVIYSRLPALEEIIRAMQHGRPAFLLLAGVFGAFYFCIYAWLFRAVLRIVDVAENFRHLLPLVLARQLVDSSAPSQGAAGVALFVDHHRRKGHSPARTAAGVLLVMVIEYATLSVLLLIDLLLLRQMGFLYSYEWLSAGLLILYTLAMLGILLLGGHFPILLEKLLAVIETLVNRISQRMLKKPYFAENWANNSAADFELAANYVLTHRMQVVRAFGWAFLAHFAAILTLGTVFLAFGQTPAPMLVFTGFCMNALFTVVSPTPNGMGVVEMALPHVYQTIGMEHSTSILIALAFRALLFWLPLVCGIFALRGLPIFREREKTSPAP